MATQAQLEALARARANKKAKDEAAKAKPKKEEPVDLPPDPANGQKNIVNKIEHDETVKFYLQGDPLNPQIRTWERSFNGHMICLEVGRVYEMPKFLVDFIEERIQIQRVSANTTADYRSGFGKNLSY